MVRFKFKVAHYRRLQRTISSASVSLDPGGILRLSRRSSSLPALRSTRLQPECHESAAAKVCAQHCYLAEPKRRSREPSPAAAMRLQRTMPMPTSHPARAEGKESPTAACR